MNLIIEETARFRRDLKRVHKRGKDFSKLERIIKQLLSQKPLPLHHRDHSLRGNYISCRECHIEPDWLLIYKINEREDLLILLRTGSHADLFS